MQTPHTTGNEASRLPLDNASQAHKRKAVGRDLGRALGRVVEDAHVIRAESGDGLMGGRGGILGQESLARVGASIVGEHLSFVGLDPLAVFTESHAV